ncbi:Peptidoglycan glycosyltransferase [Alkaliphilus metalliredigens QYMF]|uniref:Peptidoglycan glycosyltransferase n=1 Tax=Alkaliphilus metalliredigens (strain QYMF) TaxID=293826 RepID=A6TK47_ALKMQ|nr:penicillin-binding transpeptidase domain-containing protein [Alkaliphilus metalliredigens]ABR46565.1 Peptidoglycan glycosyltransferase [Alkaliphilus metalliredigens QYMF]
MNGNKRIVHLIVLTSVLFLSLISYLTYFQVFRATTIAENSFNPRHWAREDTTLRGRIYDRNGLILADSDVEEGRPIRSYPHGRLYSHVIGYHNRQYGRTGIEFYYNEHLMDLLMERPVARIRDRITGEMIQGNDLVLTIDHELQQLAHQLLGNKNGSIVALDPRNGEVLAMVSKPDYNPNTLVGDWNDLIIREDSPLLNRSIAGLYTPGSVYKILMAAKGVEEGLETNVYESTSSIVVDGYTLSNYGETAHGEITLGEALAVSANTSFARLALELGEGSVTEISRRFLMGERIPSDMPVNRSLYPYEGGLQDTELVAVSIGQGRLLVTPLHMAAMTSVFANGGVMMAPHIVQEVQSPTGRVVLRPGGEVVTVVSAEVAETVKEMMISVVEQGTGRNAGVQGVSVAGKTGTAENVTGKSHAWFVGFAPAEAPQIVVAVILESEGQTGGAAAAPIARDLIGRGIQGGN